MAWLYHCCQWHVLWLQFSYHCHTFKEKCTNKIGIGIYAPYSFQSSKLHFHSIYLIFSAL